jgi:hypothetical protein
MMQTMISTFSGEIEVNKTSVASHEARVVLRVHRYGASAEAEMSATDIDALIHLLQAARIKVT